MTWRLLIMLVLAVAACTQKKQEKPQVTAAEPQVAAAYSSIKVPLDGAAMQATSTWEPYQKFITELTNYDHSKPATNRLIGFADDMMVTVPETLAEQAVFSRLVVLNTRLGIYAAALRNKSLAKNARVKKYNDIIIAIDKLHLQLNEKQEFERDIDALYEQLQTEYSTPADSIAPSN